MICIIIIAFITVSVYCVQLRPTNTIGIISFFPKIFPLYIRPLYYYVELTVESNTIIIIFIIITHGRFSDQLATNVIISYAHDLNYVSLLRLYIIYNKLLHGIL